MKNGNGYSNDAVATLIGNLLTMGALDFTGLDGERLPMELQEEVNAITTATGKRKAGCNLIRQVCISRKLTITGACFSTLH